MSARCTEGPWSIYKHDPLVIVNAEGSSIGDAQPGDPFISREEAMANALVFAAGSDLLHVAEMMRDGDEDCRRDGLARMPPSARAALDAAIAKATGA